MWREIARVLKPGGRVAVSDIALLKLLPAAVLKLVEALISCVAGAVLTSETERMVRDAGLWNVALKSKPGHIEAMTNWEDRLYHKIFGRQPAVHHQSGTGGVDAGRRLMRGEPTR